MKTPAINIFTVLAAAALLEFSNCSAFAASGNWNTDTNGAWSVSGNWTGGIVPGTAAGDVVGLNFDISSAHTVTNDTAVTAGTLIIGDPLLPFFSYTLTNIAGGSLTLNNSGNGALIDQSTNNGAADIIREPITLADNLTISNKNGLTLSGAISGGAYNVNVWSFTNAVTLNSSTVNSYTGTTTVSGGMNMGTGLGNGVGQLVLDFTNLATPANLINNGSTLVMNQGTLQVKQKGGTTTSQTFNGVTISSSTANAIIGTGAGGGALTVALGAITHQFGGTVDFTNTSTGFITTTTANDATGILGPWATVGNTLGSASTGDWAANDGLNNITRYTGYTAVSATGITSQSGAGASAQNWIAGSPTGAGDYITYLTGSATINSLVECDSFSVPANGYLTLNSGGLILRGAVRNMLNNGVQSLNGVTNNNNAGTGFLTSGAGDGSLYVHTPLTAYTATWGIWPQIVDNGGTLVTVIKDGPGMVAFENTNSYSSGTVINNGVIELVRNVNTGLASGSPLGTGTVTINPGGQLYLNANAMTNLNNFVLNGKTVNGAITGGNQTGGTSHYLTGQIYLAADANVGSYWNDKGFIIAGLITGPGGLTFDLNNQPGTGAGGRFTLTNNANNYQGNTTVNGRLGNGNAYLILGTNNALPTTTMLTLNCADVIMNGFNQTVASLNGTNTQITLSSPVYTTTGTGNRADQIVNYSPTNATFTINNTVSNQFFGVLGGTGANENNFSLTKSGTGTLYLYGANTYANGTLISAGTLQLGNGLGFGGSVVGKITNNATLVFAYSNSPTFAGNITGTGAIIKSGVGNLTLTGTNNASGGLMISNGTVTLPVPGTFATSITVAAGATNTITAIQSGVNSVTVNDGGLFAVTESADASYLAPSTMTVGSSTGATLQFGVVGTVNPVLNVGTMTLHGTTTINITNASPAAGTYPLFTGYSSGALVLGVQPTGITGILVTNGATIGYQVTGANVAEWNGNVNAKWDVLTANWNSPATSSLFVPNYPVLFDDSASVFAVNVTNTGVVSGAMIFSNTANSYVITGGPISGASGLLMVGSNSVTLTQTNSYVGPTTISSGILTLGAQGLLGGGNYSASIYDNALLNNSNAASQTLSGVISGTGILANLNGGILTLGNVNSYSGVTTNGPGLIMTTFGNGLSTNTVVMSGGVLSPNGVAITISNSIFVTAAGGTLQTNVTANNPDLTIAGNITGSGPLYLSAYYNKDGLNLVGDDSGYNGTVTVPAAAGNNRLSSATAGSAAAQWVINGNLELNNAGATAYQLGSLSGASTGGISGHAPNPTLTPETLTIGALNTSTIFAGVIVNNAAGNAQTGNSDTASNNVLTIVKVGTGALTLSGANSYSGDTTVKNGTLNTSTLSTGGGNFTVASGATLGVAIQKGSMLMTSLTVTNCVNNLSGVASTINPAVLCSNALTIVGTVTVNITSGALIAGKSYPLYTWGSTTGGGNFVLGVLPAGAAGSLITSGNTNYLSVTANSSPYLWTGANTTNWDFTTFNWKANAIATNYTDGVIAQFDDTATDPTNVFVVTTVAPGQMIVSNNANNYIIATTNNGSKITGGGSLTKYGSGTLTLTNLNSDFSGGVTITGGVVEVSGAANLGIANGSVNLAAGTVSVLKGGFTDTHVWSVGPSSGSGAVTINLTNTASANGASLLLTNFVIGNNGAGTGGLNISGVGLVQFPAAVSSLAAGGSNNTYSGNMTISGGATNAAGGGNSANFGVSGPFGNGGTITLNNGTLTANGTQNTNNNPIVVLAGGGTLQTNNAGGDITFYGNITGSGPLSLGAKYNVDGLNLAGDDSGYSGTVSIGAVNANCRLLSQTAGSAAATWVVNGGLAMNNYANLNAPNTFQFGALVGASTGAIAGHAPNSNGGANIQTLVVGALNTSTLYAGWIGNNVGGSQATGGNNDQAAGNVLALAKVGTGILTLSNSTSVYGGGTFLTNGVISLQANNSGATGPLGSTGTTNVISFAGGTLQFSTNGYSDFSARIANSTSAMSFDVNGTNVTMTNALASSNTGGLALTNSFGSGNLFLGAANSYSGNTVINGGTLTLSNSAAIPSTSTNIVVGTLGRLNVTPVSYTLGAAQILSGSGVVTGNVTTVTGSEIAEGTPTNTVGNLTFNNSLNLTNGGNVVFKLSPSASGANDQIILNGSGTLTLSGRDTIHLGVTSGLKLDQTADYVLFSNLSATVMVVAPVLAFDAVNTPTNANHYSIQQIGNNVVLRYSPIASPSIVITAVTNTVNNTATAVRGQTIVINATVTLGSANVTNVSVDLSQLGGGTAMMTYIGGGSGNGDGNYSYTYVVGQGAAVGVDNVVALATDTNPRTASDLRGVTISATAETWDGLSTLGDNWGYGTNWVSDRAPGFIGDSVDFTGSTRLTPNLEASYSVAGLLFDGSASAFNIGATAGKSLTLTGGVTNSSPNAQILNLPIVLSGQQTIEDVNSNGIALSGPVSGAGGIYVDNGSVALGGANSYVGNTVINGALLVASNSSAIPFGAGVGNVSLQSGIGGLNLNGYNVSINGLTTFSNSTVENLSANPLTLTLGGNDQNGTISGTLTDVGNGAISLVKVGAGTLTIAKDGNYKGTTTISNGIVIVGDPNSFSEGTANVIMAGGGIGAFTNGLVASPLPIANNLVIQPNTTNTFGSPQSREFNFTGTVTGSGTIQNYPGSNMTVTASIYWSGEVGAFTGTFLYTSTGANGVWMRFGALASMGTTFDATNANFVSIAAGGGLDMGFPDNSIGDTIQMGSLSGNGFFQGPYGGNTGHLIVGYLNTSTVFSGNMGATFNGEQNFDFTKVGSGTLTALGPNGYIGGTIISQGELDLSTLSFGGGPVTVGDGTTFGLVVTNGANSLTIATLTDATSGGTVINNITGLNSTTVPAINCTNGLVLNGTVVVNVSISSAVFVNQQYPLISFPASSESGTGGFVLGTLSPAGIVANIITNGNQIVLNITKGQPGFTWTGLTSTNWDFITANNWLSNAVSVLWQDGNVAQFDDTSSRTNVNVAATVSPIAILFTNIANNYTLGSAAGAKITGSGSMIVNGTGTVTLTNLSSDFSGGVVINSGLVQVASSTNLGLASGTVLINSNATLRAVQSFIGSQKLSLGSPGTVDVAAGQTFTVTNKIINNSVSNQLVKTGSGIMMVMGTNSYTGGTVVNGGNLIFSNILAGASNTAQIYNINNGATLTFNYNYLSSITNNIELGQNSVISGNGNLVKTGAGGLWLNGLNTQPAFVSLTNGVISVLGGYLRNENVNPGAWNANMDGLNVTNGAYFDVWDCPNTIVDAINGNGVITKGWSVAATLTVGVANGSGNFSGFISNNLTGLYGSNAGATGGNLSLVKIGTGTQILSGTNNYAGTTTISNGTLEVDGSIAAGAVTVVGGALAGSGTVNGAVTVPTGSSLLPGSSNSIGTLILASTLAFNGNLAVYINTSLAPAATNDSVAVTGALSGTSTGTITVSNVGPALVAGAKFFMFNKAFSGGTGMTITPAPGVNLAWSNNLATDGSIIVLAVPAQPTENIPPTGTPITFGQAVGASTINSVANSWVNASTNVPGTYVYNSPGSHPGAPSSIQAATFTPNDTVNLLPVVFNITLTVNPQTPVLQTAPTASSITSGQSLSSSILSGGSVTNIYTAGVVSGSFAFTSPGTTPPVGTNPQSVTFTPIDTTDYNSINFNVNVTVTGSGVTYLAFTAHPVVVGTTNLTIYGTNAGAGTFYMLTSTNVAAHKNIWTPVWTNVTGGSSSFTNTVTNAVTPASGKQFYLLSTTNDNGAGM